VLTSYPGVTPYKSATSLVDAPHRYNVLGWFYVTDVRKEGYRGPDGVVSIYVLRFDKVEVGKPSWWYPEDRTPGDPTGYALPGVTTVPSKKCGECGETSEEVFEQGWTCSNSECGGFFKFPASVDIDDLQYSSDYLRRRKQFEPAELPQLPGPLPHPEYDGDLEFGTEVAFRKGMVCPKCGSCASRVYWDRWECPLDRSGCGFRHYAVLLEYPLQAVHGETAALEKKLKGKNAKYPNLHLDPRIVQEDWATGGYAVTTYLLPDQDGNLVGTFSHFKATPAVCSKADGADMLLAEIQQVASRKGELTVVDLKRNPAKNPGGKFGLPCPACSTC